MKILQINCVYGTGSTGRLVESLHKGLLSQGHESIVCYGRGKRFHDPGVYKTCTELYAKGNKALSTLTGLPYGGCVLSTQYLLNIIRRERPDIVHLHSINGNFVNIYRLISYLKKHRIKTVLTLHAEFLYTAGCNHAGSCDGFKTDCPQCPGKAGNYARMKKAFQGFEGALQIISVSRWLAKRARESHILGTMAHRVIGNGVDTTVFRPQEIKQNGKTVLHVTAAFSERCDHPKGGYYLLELAKREDMRNVTFLIAAQTSDSIPRASNVIFLGNINDPAELARYYTTADVTVLTSRHETFSMPCAESLCCGTPVVGFRAGGPEEIALPEYSRFVPFGNVEALAGCVKAFLSRPVRREIITGQARAVYSDDIMLTNYLSIYKELL